MNNIYVSLEKKLSSGIYKCVCFQENWVKDSVTYVTKNTTTGILSIWYPVNDQMKKETIVSKTLSLNISFTT